MIIQSRINNPLEFPMQPVHILRLPNGDEFHCHYREYGELARVWNHEFHFAEVLTPSTGTYLEFIQGHLYIIWRMK